MDGGTRTLPRLRLTVPVPMKTGKVVMSPGEDGLIGIPFPEHSSELLSHLNDQRRAGLLCDLTLTSRGARYPTHRSVMAAVSLYFRQLFGSEEGGADRGGGFSVCQLDCVAPDALDALLEFAYTATLTIPSSGMRDVLQGAQLLGIQCVADACRDILGETAEAEKEFLGEPRVLQADVVKTPQAERGMVTLSRRKTDKKKIKSIRQHHAAPPSLNPPPPHLSHPAVFACVRQLPLSPVHAAAQSGTRGAPSPPRAERRPPGGRRDGESAHAKWRLCALVQRAPALGPPAAVSGDRVSEDDDMEGFGDNDALMGNASTPTSLASQGRAAAAAVAGRKRKSQTPQQCPVCQKIIHGAGKLPRHMRTHTGEKPFQCNTCGVRFTRNDKLKIHMRKHTGERPYTCPHCPARFLHSYDLKNHLSLHSGARPFECPLCHKAFAREDHLQRHRKGHSCLEMRTRRPRRGPDHWEDGGAGVNGREQSNPLEAFPLQAHPSVFLPSSAGDGGSGSGPPLMFPGEAERGRSLALQALAHLGPHRLAGYPLILRSLDLRMGNREAEVEDPGRRRRSPASHQDQWADKEKEESGEKEAEEEE
ncbi:LOW QUALITY PROTEIN: zinc finger and BTB domain-containing protein 7B [Takifugu rubripes]|uniref:LOW QUALITY PROTEIN: zinc finger and BTB domain-containing protein 7B n=1 Tax=Takifugu rubripes TaxID=31033 RepID=UPI001145D3CA|nr:LOW QUALITY PROTEIN: zinc finger and BTB domain-containing protein 7B [Takifugu rubripes]